jgi:cell division protein FtsL
MPRLLPLIAIATMLVSAFFLYGVKYDTRRLEIDVHAKERTAERTRADIAVLNAERAHLARPDRIESLARALGMRPAMPEQYLRLDRAAAIDGAAKP